MLKQQLAVFALCAAAAAQEDYTQYVDVFAGTTNGGNMFPGVVAEPFAPVKPGPDCVYATGEAYVGYLPDAGAKVTGYSLLHESGIGGAAKYGVVSQMPVPGNISNPLVDLSRERARPDEGSVGYYKSEINSGAVTELAGTQHSGLYQYSFPVGQVANVVVDISHVLPSFRDMGWGQMYHGGSLDIAADGHYEGNGTYSNGWNNAPEWTVHFCGRFDQRPSLYRTFKGQAENIGEYGQNSQVASDNGDRVGGVFAFNATQITSRVGVSWVSSQRACQYVDEEMPPATDLASLVARSKAIWNTEALSKVTTSDRSNQQNLEMLYTNMYGLQLLPSNRTGDNPDWTSAEPYYDDIYTFWDWFRCTTALRHVLAPATYEELLRSIIDTWRYEGFLPDARSSNFNGKAQGGSNADNVLADAYVKGVRGDINWEDAYAAMQTDAEKVPPPNNDPSARDSSTKEGRGALPDWLSLGYITPQYTRAVTRAVEYAGNDFGLYQVATGLGLADDSIRYLQRSRQWRNHWNPEETSLNSSGFLVPRQADGAFLQQNPLECGGCYWAEAYYEGLPWEYSVNAHHDAAHLIELSGGNDAFVQRLNTLLDPANAIFKPGNEPSFTTPYLYHFVNRQDLSVAQSRRIAKTSYGTGPAALPGNSDGGAMQSWILWNMIGLYPVTGQTTFLVGSPWFSSLTMQTPSGRELVITSTGGSENSYYVQSLRVNGQDWNRNWVTWDDIFANGGTLEFVLGPEPARWDTGDLPPSPASVKQSDSDDGLPAKAPPVRDTVSMPALPPTQEIVQDRKLIAAIVLASLVGVLILTALVTTILCLKRRKEPEHVNKDLSDDPKGAVESAHDSLTESLTDNPTVGRTSRIKWLLPQRTRNGSERPKDAHIDGGS